MATSDASYSGKLLIESQEKPEIPDISSSLLEDLRGRDPTTKEYYQLLGDVELIIAAGRYATLQTYSHNNLGSHVK